MSSYGTLTNLNIILRLINANVKFEARFPAGNEKLRKKPNDPSALFSLDVILARWDILGIRPDLSTPSAL